MRHRCSSATGTPAWAARVEEAIVARRGVYGAGGVSDHCTLVHYASRVLLGPGEVACPSVPLCGLAPSLVLSGRAPPDEHHDDERAELHGGGGDEESPAGAGGRE